MKDYCKDEDVPVKIEEVKAQKEAYLKEKEEQSRAEEQAQKAEKIESLKNEQQVVVTSTEAWDDGYSMVFMKGEVVVQNNTGKVAKNVEYSILQFD